MHLFKSKLHVADDDGHSDELATTIKRTKPLNDSFASQHFHNESNALAYKDKYFNIKFGVYYLMEKMVP